jgi:hypothetical protein
MPSHRRKQIQINIAGETVELSNEHIKFYLKETQRKVPRKSSIEKFYNNIIRLFTSDDTRLVE